MRHADCRCRTGLGGQGKGVDETLTAISRAGADVIITYFAENGERFKTADKIEKCRNTAEIWQNFFNV